MQIDKTQILDLLRSRGEHDKADQAGAELPDQVDTEKDSGLLAKYGIDVKELLGKLGGGKLGGMLGG
jgi:hypothetical protein